MGKIADIFIFMERGGCTEEARRQDSKRREASFGLIKKGDFDGVKDEGLSGHGPEMNHISGIADIDADWRDAQWL